MGGLLLMNTIRLNWADFKALITTKNLIPRLQYTFDESESNGTMYSIWFEEGSVSYTCNINDGDCPSDVVDFETNYKNNANQPIEQLTDCCLKKVAIVPIFKTTYKCQVKAVTDQWQEYDLETIYTDFTVMNSGNQDIIIKLNSNTNDEIPLSGGENIRDIIGAENFALTKIYYKTSNDDDTSNLFVWATK